MWKLIATVALITQLSAFAAVITSNHEVAFNCNPYYTDGWFVFVDCDLVEVKSSKDPVFVTSSNFDVKNEDFDEKTVRIRVNGNVKYPEYFPKNLAKLINGANNFYYKKTPLKYISRDDFKDFGPKLTLLSLQENEIEDIPFDTFYDLPSLRDLNLRNNHIKTLESTLFANTPNLGVLFADFNQIEELNKDLFKNNPMMTVITMRHNKIKNVPFNFAKFEDLHAVDFTHNSGTCDTMYFAGEPWSDMYDEVDLKKWIKIMPEFMKKIEEVCRQ